MFQNVASSSSMVVPRLEQIQRIELSPNDIKLEETRNYLSWSRRAILNLQKRGLEKYVLEANVEPLDKSGVEWQNWKTTNSFVVSWILDSATPSVANNVIITGSDVDSLKSQVNGSLVQPSGQPV